jgi:hypothetical protein
LQSKKEWLGLKSKPNNTQSSSSSISKKPSKKKKERKYNISKSVKNAKDTENK